MRSSLALCVVASVVARRLSRSPCRGHRRERGQRGDPVDGPRAARRRQQPGPRLRAKSAKVSAVVYFGWKPSVSRIWSVATTRPWVSSRICSGEKSVMPDVRSSEPDPGDGGQQQRHGGPAEPPASTATAAARRRPRC